MDDAGGLQARRAERRVGAVLAGKYRVERLLGVGGMAAVYAAVHRNARRVALKVLHADLSFREDVRARFVREGYAANAIGHPGVVAVLDDDVAEDGAAFLVMELLEGETLNRRLRRRGGRLPCGEVLTLAAAWLDVLAAAHERGVVHRDIKPENLFLTRALTLKVLDFGIAHVENDPTGYTTRGGARLGTPAYMPPEQARGRSSRVDARSDLWSSGATMFKLLSGATVHEADTPEEIIARTAEQPARSLAAAAPDVPEAVIALVDRALAFEREDRFQSAVEMKRAVEEAYAALTGEPIAGATLDPPAPRAAVERGSATVPLETSTGSTRPDGVTRTALTDDVIHGDGEAGPRAPTPAARAPRPRRRALAAVIAFAAALGAAWLGFGARAPAPRAATPPAARACTSHRACTAANEGRASACRAADGACVEMASSLCRVLAEPSDAGDDATIWIGAMFPKNEIEGTQAANAVEIARRDFASAGGLPGLAGGPRRRIGVVLCDDSADPPAAARHLVDDLGLPAVLGFARSREVVELATSVFNPKRVLALAANTASILRDIPRVPGEPRLVWRVTTSSDAVVPPAAAVLAQVMEPALRAEPGLLRPGEPIRLAMVRVENASGSSLSDLFVNELRWNGRGVLENGDAFRSFVVPDTPDVDHAAVYVPIAAEVAAARPHVVLLAGAGEAFVPALEARWPERSPYRPRYLTIELIGPAIRALAKSRPDVRRRLLAVDAASSPALGKYVVRYAETFPAEQPTPDPSSAPYDAFYALAYALAALGEEPATGPALARALARLRGPGKPIDVGPAGIFVALDELRAGRNIDLRGTVTSLDFDPETGDSETDFGVYCFAPDTPADAPAVIEGGLSFEARSRRLEGKLRCR